MAYLRCTHCGSKALVAASRCPRCAHEFDLVDARGERVKLKPCRGCGILHRVDRTCHWCGEVKSSVIADSGVMRRAAAVALLLVGAGTVYRVAPAAMTQASVFASSMLREAREDLQASTRRARTAPVASVAIASPEAPTDANAYGTTNVVTNVAATPVPDAMTGTVSDPAMSSVAVLDGTSATAAPASRVASADSVRWTPAVARTWVNVRADASRGGEVVGVIAPTTRAMLGTDRAGWRLVKSTDVSGWVDPRLFEPDSLRTRGN